VTKKRELVNLFFRCIPTRIISKMIMNIDGITSASINVSMYLFIIIDDNDVFVDDAGLAIF
jgi:hypothetical protein